MSAADHRPTSWDTEKSNCIWCHEPWPCTTTRIRQEVIESTVTELLETVRPKGPESGCCDEHAARWQERQDIADDLAEWLEGKVKEIHAEPE